MEEVTWWVGLSGRGNMVGGAKWKRYHGGWAKWKR